MDGEKELILDISMIFSLNIRNKVCNCWTLQSLAEEGNSLDSGAYKAIPTDIESDECIPAFMGLCYGLCIGD